MNSPEKETPAQQTPRKITGLVRGAPFLAALALLSLVSWFLPLRPTYSDSEKRELRKFPDFSVSSVFDGSWFDGVSLWYSDTFPGRDGWVGLNNRLQSVHGLNRVAVYGSDITADAIPGIDPAQPPVMGTPIPAATPAPSPAPPVSTKGNFSPAPSPPTVSALPEATQEPPEPVNLEEGLTVDLNAARAYGSVTIIGDSGYENYGFGESASAAYGQLLAQAAELLDGKSRVFSLIIPNATGIVLAADIASKILVSDERAGIAYTYSQMGEKVYPVQVFDTLRSHNKEYIYLRTDHHWTALGAWYAYEQWAIAAGFEPVTLDNYALVDNGDFLGSFYWDHAQTPAMAANPDRIYAYDPPGEVSMVIHNADGSSYEWPVITDMSEYHIGKKYLSFLYGDHYISEITNDDIQDDSACLVIKDSNGNPFTVYLSQHYHKVYVVDFRFNFGLSSLVNRYGIDDVIVLNTLTLTQGSTTLANFKSDFR